MNLMTYPKGDGSRETFMQQSHFVSLRQKEFNDHEKSSVPQESTANELNLISSKDIDNEFESF